MILKLLVCLLLIGRISVCLGDECLTAAGRSFAAFDYAKAAPDNSHTNPLTIRTSIQVEKLVETSGGLQLNTIISQSWKDPRLNYSEACENHYTPSKLELKKEMVRLVWLPQVFYRTDKERNPIMPGDKPMVVVHEDGSVDYSRNLVFQVPCVSNLKKFPGGVYTCRIDFFTQGFFADHVMDSQSVHISDSVSAYSYEHISVSTCGSDQNCVRAVITFNHLVSTGKSARLYIIPLLLVILSWFPFITMLESVALRVFIAFSCLFAFIVHWGVVASEFSIDGTGSGPDVWMSRCLLFIAATILQLIIYIWIVRATQWHEKRQRSKAPKKILVDEKNEVIATVETQEQGPLLKVGNIVDIISLILFALTFVLFLIHYCRAY